MKKKTIIKSNQNIKWLYSNLDKPKAIHINQVEWHKGRAYLRKEYHPNNGTWGSVWLLPLSG